MRLKYIGPFNEVLVPLEWGGEITVKKDEVKDLPDSMAEGLLTQKSNWIKAETKSYRMTKDGEN